jgi:hypothetical protein
MPLTNYGLDHLVSQELSKLSRCTAPEVTSSFPEARYWVSNFVLNSAFGSPLRYEAKRFGFAFLRRAEAAFVEYDHARVALDEYVQTRPRKPSLYFRVLHHFEVTVTMLYQALDFGRRFAEVKLFERGDGSKHERLNLIYNVSRHFDPAALPLDHLHAVWIANDGIHIADCSLTFRELGELLTELGQSADKVSRIERKQNASSP